MDTLEAIRFVVKEAETARHQFYDAKTAQQVYAAARTMAEALYEIRQVLQGQ